MSGPNDGQTELEFRHIVCRVHGEPFRWFWPSGVTVFGLRALQFVLENEEFCKELGRIKKPLPVALRRRLAHRPLCCRVRDMSPDKLLGLYETVDIGDKGICTNCGEWKLGTPYAVKRNDGQVSVTPHLCFACVVSAVYIGVDRH